MSPLVKANLGVALFCCASTVAPWAAWAGEPTTVRVAASERYQASRAFRFGFGGGYRDLWGAKVNLPLVDLRTGGGLRPVARFGGLQTAVLAFQSADGRKFTFRGTDKDPSAVLPPALRKTALSEFVRDQTAAQHPGGPVVTSVLSQAAGLLTIRERLMVMPDDPSLGKYRKEFAGMVGSFYAYPGSKTDRYVGFHGATEIISHEELYRRLRAGHVDQVDREAFLRARLFDLMVGDFDRHRKQWRWAKLPGNPKWQPIPEDRDQAFVRYDGFVQRVGAILLPILQCYGEDYPSIHGLTVHGWEQDRWLLPGLSWPAWKAIAKDIKKRVSNRVIDAAVGSLPPEYVKLDGKRLTRDLRGRRNKLLDAARKFYEHLASSVDIQGTDAAEDVLVEWTADNKMSVQVRAPTAPASSPPLFTRRFDPDDTDEVRLYLRGGADQVFVKGSDAGAITLRVIAGKGPPKRLHDETGCVELYDQHQVTLVSSDSGTRVITEPYTPPASSSGFVDVDGVPPRDWGRSFLPYPLVSIGRDKGLVIGAALSIKEYGFRKHPWSRKHNVSAAFSTGALLPIVRYRGQFRPQNSEHVGHLLASYSGITLTRFYGVGNETSGEADSSYYRVRHQLIEVRPGYTFNLMDHQLRVSIDANATLSSVFDGSGLINVLKPYGSESFGHVGVSLSVVADTRASLFDDGEVLRLPMGHANPAAGYPTSGILFELFAKVSPPVWDVDQVWGSVFGSLSGHLATSDGRFSFAARVGGQYTFGKTPFFALAFIGGGGGPSVGGASRGLQPQRYAGKAAVFGNLDLKLYLADFNLIVPFQFGLLAFADVGRVFVTGDRSEKWHPSGGGGVWFAPLARTNAISLSFAGAEENFEFYLRGGFFY